MIGWNRGDKGALDRLMPFVYEELRNVARRRLAVEDREHTLQSAALVNEAYPRLVDQQPSSGGTARIFSPSLRG